MSTPLTIVEKAEATAEEEGKAALEAQLGAIDFRGHRDSKAGRVPTLAPTASILAHNTLNMVAAQLGWAVHEGGRTRNDYRRRERSMFARPEGYPEHVTSFIKEKVGEGCRSDLLTLRKGGFDLCEPPRLWYLEYKATLKDINLNKLKLISGLWPSTRMDTCERWLQSTLTMLATLETTLRRRSGTPWIGNVARPRMGGKSSVEEDPTTLEFYYTMEDYMAKIPDIVKEEWAAEKGPLTEQERVKVPPSSARSTGRPDRGDMISRI